MLEDSVSPKKYEGRVADLAIKGRGRQALPPKTVGGCGTLRTVLHRVEASNDTSDPLPSRPQDLRRQESWAGEG